MKSFIDYYALLQTTPDADEELIKRAYRILSKRYHPDLGGNSDKFILLTKAYETLIDKNRRIEYDKIYKLYQYQKQKENERIHEEKIRKQYEEKYKQKSTNSTTENNESSSSTSNANQAQPISNETKPTTLKTIINASLIITVVLFIITYINDSINSGPEQISYLEINEEDEEENNVVEPKEQIEFMEEENYVAEGIDMSEDNSFESSIIMYSDIYKDIEPKSEIFKRYYIRLRDMEDDLITNYPLVWEEGTYFDQSTSAQGYLSEWDAMLNEIYGVIKNSFSESEFIYLRDLQRQWIIDRDLLAENARSNFEGGLQEEAIYYNALLEATRERSYWLITNYLN